CFLDTADDGRDVFLRNRTTDNLVFNFHALAFFIGRDGDAGVAILTFTTRLTDEFAFAFSVLSNGFAIRDLRSAGVGFHFEFAFQAVDNDFQVKLTHARDDELAGFFIGEAAERRIFFRETLQTFRHFVAVLLGLRFDGHADDGFGERRGLQRHVEIFVTQRVTGGDVAQTDERGDVTGINAVDILAFAALNNHEAADALTLARAWIVYG